MLDEELARTGQMLFKVRGEYIYVVIGFGVVAAYLNRAPGPFADDLYNAIWFAVGLVVASTGLLIRVLTHGFAAFGTSGRAKEGAEAEELNTTGLYSLVRNPLYLGRIVNFTGLALMSGSWAYGSLIFLLAILVYERICFYEEKFLLAKFGQAYVNWAAEVPALFPRWHGFKQPNRPFWLRRMIWREYRKLFQLLTAIVLYSLAWHGFRWASLPVGPGWYVAVGALIVARIGFKLAKMMGVFRGLR